EAPRCIVAATPTTISLAPLQPSPTVAAPFTTQSLSAEIKPATPTAKAGGTLSYEVDLTNTSTETVSFDPCPLVPQSLGSVVRGDKRNCADAGDLKAGGTLTFRMQLPIPASTPARTDTLTWMLDPFSSRPVQASAKATVSG